MDPTTTPLRSKLADFIHDASFANFSVEEVRCAKRCVLDFIGVSIAGCQQEVSTVIGEVVSDAGGLGEATVWGSDCKVPVASAALLNAVHGHAIDMDDGYRYATTGIRGS